LTDPPQYLMDPRSPQCRRYPTALYHQPPRRPGLTTAAVVLMWVLFGLGLLSGLMTALALTVGRDVFAVAVPALADWIPLVLVVWTVQTVAFAVLRARFALRIMRRSASARRGAFIVEGFGIGFQVIAQAALFAAVFPVPEGTSFSFQFDCTGIVLSILVLCFLGSARSAWWCDR
jgi:hypothetical protein